MVLDVVDPCRGTGRAAASLVREQRLHAADAAVVLQPVADRVEAGTVLEREERLLEEVRLGIARDRDVRDVVRGRMPPIASTVRDGLGGEAGPVLDAVEPLLLDARVERRRPSGGRPRSRRGKR